MKPNYFIESAEPISPWDYEHDGKYYPTAKEAVDEAINYHGPLWQVVKREVVFTSADKEAVAAIWGDAVWSGR
jgi:hypothetical protein